MSVASIIALNGSGQKLALDTATYKYFPIKLSVLLLQADGSPAAGEIVTFVCPSSPAYGAFFGVGPSTTATSDSSGVATVSASVYNYPGMSTGNWTIIATPNSNAGIHATFYMTTQANGAAIQLGALQLPGTQFMTATANTNFSDSCQAFVFNNNDASLNGYSITLEMVSPTAGAYFLDNGLTTLTLLSSGGQIANSGMHAGSGLGTFQIIGYSTADGHASPYLPNCFWQLTVRDPTLSYAINVNSGNGQSSDVGIPFAAALTAMVVNNVGTPLAGKSVTFTAPASGTSCTFAGSNTQTVTTDGSGIATSSVPVANAVVGTYSVQATTPGVAIPATFTLTNSTPATPAQPHDGLLYCEM